MKKASILFPIFLFLLYCSSCDSKVQDSNSINQFNTSAIEKADTINATNDFYDNADTYVLQTCGLEVLGEITNAGKVDFSELPLRSIIVKETLLEGDGDTFIGAFRYDGYSLYDILNKRRLDKKNPLFSPKVDILIENKLTETLLINPETIPEQSLHTVFYGRGRGIHSTQPFTGVSLKTYFNGKIGMTRKALREGIFVVSADDGYRSVYTYSEVCNRNDQAEVLLICRPELTHEGVFGVFPSCDFFSDRAVHGITEISYSESQK